LGIFLGVLAAAVAALPAAWRAASPESPFFLCWIALAGTNASVVAPATGALRAAQPLSERALVLLSGVALVVTPFSLFARTLRLHTHHRPLAAATYAVVSAAMLLAALAFTAQLERLVRQRWGRRWSSAVPTILGAASLFFGLSSLAKILLESREVRNAVFDGSLTLALVACMAFWRGPIGWRRVRWLGPGAWLLVSIGAAIVLRSPEVFSRVASEAPVLLGPLWFSL
jgi:hypothetical protein